MNFSANNTNSLARQVYQSFLDHGIRSDTRNGPVLQLPGLTTITLWEPVKRVNFCPVRNANPFFHLFEAMAMLVGLNDAVFLSYFAKNMMNFVDEGETHFNAFYGTRMSRHGQFQRVIETLKADPTSRRCYVDLWDIADLSKVTKDMACNVGMVFSMDHCDRLTMTTFNRSNDAVWGHVTGANIVHFSFFQEYVALCVGKPVGPWYHSSANLHVYTEMKGNPWSRIVEKMRSAEDYDYVPGLNPLPLFNNAQPFAQDEFNTELGAFMFQAARPVVCGGTTDLSKLLEPAWSEPFIDKILKPMLIAWVMHKNRFTTAQCLKTLTANMPEGNDWRLAGEQWITNNHKT